MSEDFSKEAGGSQKEVTRGTWLVVIPIAGPTESRELNWFFYLQYYPESHHLWMFFLFFFKWVDHSFAALISLSGFCTLLGLTTAFGPMTVLSVSTHSGSLHAAELSLRGPQMGTRILWGSQDWTLPPWTFKPPSLMSLLSPLINDMCHCISKCESWTHTVTAHCPFRTLEGLLGATSGPDSIKQQG